LEEIDCFSLIDVLVAVRSDPELLRLLDDRLEDYKKLNDFRDKVSHSGLDIAASVSDLDELIGAKHRLLGVLRTICRSIDSLG
jgi:hypothetical protein